MPAEPAPGRAVTPGQRYLAAYWASYGYAAPVVPWDQLVPEEQAAEEAGAAAVAAPLNAEIARLRGQLDRLRIAGTDLRRRLDDLASWWEHEYASETGWPSRCARELREALQGGGDGD